MEAGLTPQRATTPASSTVRSRRRSRITTISPRTHWARSLSGVQIQTLSMPGTPAHRAAAAARASSASNSTIGHTTSPMALMARSANGNWASNSASVL